MFYKKAPRKNRGAFLFALCQRCLTLTMIKKLLPVFVLYVLLLSCNNGTKTEPVTDTDVATTFIRAVLDNDFKTAEKYLLVDETNKQYFETFRHQYQSKEKAELENYKAADIVINEIKPENDSVHLVNYSNSYKKEIQNKLKLVWVNSQWRIDLKYTFAENQ